MPEGVQQIGKVLMVTGAVIALIGAVLFLSGKDTLGRKTAGRYSDREKKLHLLFSSRD